MGRRRVRSPGSGLGKNCVWGLVQVLLFRFRYCFQIGDASTRRLVKFVKLGKLYFGLLQSSRLMQSRGSGRTRRIEPRRLRGRELSDRRCARTGAYEPPRLRRVVRQAPPFDGGSDGWRWGPVVRGPRGVELPPICSFECPGGSTLETFNRRSGRRGCSGGTDCPRSGES